MAITPDGCRPHQDDHKNSAWELYTIAELGQWVHLLTKRAEHRTNFAKKDKDLTDASNYLAMMQSKLAEAKHVNMESFAQVIMRELQKLTDVKIGEIEGSPDMLALALFIPNSDPYRGFEATYVEFIKPAILALADSLEEITEIYELEPLPAEMGSRTLCVKSDFDDMAFRIETSYDSIHQGGGTRTTISIGVPKEMTGSERRAEEKLNKHGMSLKDGKYVDGKFYPADAEKPTFIADEGVLDPEDRGEGFPEEAVEHIKELGMEDFRRMYEEDPESLGFPKKQVNLPQHERDERIGW